MNRRLTIPRTFDPSYSLLGRWLRTRGDRLQAEDRYYLYAVTIFAGVLLAQFGAWAILKEAILGEPRGTLALAFVGSQASAVLVFISTCVVGFRPPAVIALHVRMVEIRQGAHAARIQVSEIVDVETVPALTYHRIHRRYADVVEFAGRSESDYLLLHLHDRTVALCLDADQTLVLTGWIERERTRTSRTLADVA